MDIKKSVYWEIFSLTWQYFKMFYLPQSDDNDEYWGKACEAADNLYEKFDEFTEGKEFGKALLLAVVNELENINSNKK